MQRWLPLAGLGVCLLLALAHPEAGRGVDSHPCIACSRCIGPWGEPARASSPARAARKTTPRQAHAPASESRAVHLLLLTERDVGPPWLDSRGPPGKVRETLIDSQAVGQIGTQSQGEPILPQQGLSTPWQTPPQEGGFATAFS